MSAADARCHNTTAGRCLHVNHENPEDDMASTTRIPKAELTGVYGAIVKRMSAASERPIRVHSWLRGLTTCRPLSS